MTGAYFQPVGRVVYRQRCCPALMTNVLLQRRGSLMLEYALLWLSLHIQSLPGASVAKMSRIWFSAGRRAFGGGCGSSALMPVAFSRHLHFELDLGRTNADAVGGAEVGFTPLVTVWIN